MQKNDNNTELIVENNEHEGLISFDGRMALTASYVRNLRTMLWRHSCWHRRSENCLYEKPGGAQPPRSATVGDPNRPLVSTGELVKLWSFEHYSHFFLTSSVLPRDYDQHPPSGSHSRNVGQPSTHSRVRSLRSWNLFWCWIRWDSSSRIEGWVHKR